jgi:transcriptional regulator with XRE-family HTH domain
MVKTPRKSGHRLISQVPTGPHANRLGQARVKAGLSQSELIERSGLSESYVKQMESGRRALTADALLALSQALSCAPEDIAMPDPDTQIKEAILLARFRMMAEDDRQLFLATARRLASA